MKCILKHQLILIGLLMSSLSVITLANEENANSNNASGEKELAVKTKDVKAESSLLRSDEPLVIDPLIAKFAKLSLDKHLITAKNLKSVEALSTHLNVAEQYLVSILRANYVVKSSDNSLAKSPKLNAIVEMLVAAKKLEEQIPEAQTNSPLFSQANLLLAQAYIALGNYELAFNERKEYLNKERDDWVITKKKTISLLNEKYETDHKTKENELLENKNRLKQRQIEEVANNHGIQQRNTIIFICIAIAFLFLMMRQIKIRGILKQLAQTDSLTRLLNRKSLFDRGFALVKQSQTNNIEMSVVLLDLDYFKQVNDTYGHGVGDEVLKIVAILGCETMRSRDIFARLGGEEFVAVLPDANLEEAKAIAQRLREKINSCDLSEFGVTSPISASFGVAALSQVDPDFDALLHGADEAMYIAKANGRNQVCSYHSE